jgi:hypothetical protein
MLPHMSLTCIPSDHQDMCEQRGLQDTAAETISQSKAKFEVVTVAVEKLCTYASRWCCLPGKLQAA